MSTPLQLLIEQILEDASSKRIGDAAFRQRVRRVAAKLQRLADEQPAAPRRPRKPGAGQYVFIGVPTADGRITSISIAADTFAQFEQALGGRREVAAAARKVALGHKPESGMSRSAYIVRRLRQRVAKLTGGQEGGSTAAEPADGGENGNGNSNSNGNGAADAGAGAKAPGSGGGKAGNAGKGRKGRRD